MLIRTLLAFVVLIVVALVLVYQPWRGDYSLNQPSVERADDLLAPASGEEGTVPLERPEGTSRPAARTDIVVESPTPVSARTFTCTVTGRLVDSLGKPLGRGILTHANGVARSDPGGHFQLEFTLARKQRDGQALALSLEGYVSRTLEFVATEQVELGDVVMAAAGSFSGRVVDVEGNGVAGAEVLVTKVVQAAFVSRNKRPSDPLMEAHADNSGAFKLEGLAGGDVRLWAGAPGMFWAYTDDLRVKPGEETRDVVLRLEPQGAEDEISLLVIDPAGEPVPLARVEFSYRGEGRSGTGSGDADEQGRYRYAVTYNATHDFMARDSENRYRPVAARAVPPGTVDLILPLGEPRALAILVSDLRGEPVPDFTAQCTSWAEDRALSGESVGPGDAEAPGRATIQLPFEEFEVTVVADGYQRSTVGRFDPGAVGSSIEVQLTPLPGVKGRVVDWKGRPIEGARVGLHEAVGVDGSLEVNGFPCRSGKGPSARTTTDADGNFKLTLRKKGSFYLRGTSEGWAPSEAGPFDIVPDLATEGLELVLAEGGTLEGQVIVAQGESPAGRIVGISRADGFGVTARANADGSYRFAHLTPGRWLVQGRRDEISANSTTSSSGRSKRDTPLPWSCSVMEGQVTRFDLDLSNAARVVVEGDFMLSGGPAVGWQVTLNDPKDRRTVASETIDSQGAFRLELEEAGAYELRLVGRWEDSPMYFVTQDLELVAGTRAWSRDLPLGRVDGTTSLAEGERLSYSWSGSEGLKVHCGFSPSESGTFSLPVPAGPGVLKRTSQAAEEAERAIDVLAGTTLQVDLQ